MTAVGPKRTFHDVLAMSALKGEADIGQPLRSPLSIYEYER
jgi:hypothetical protein